MANLENPVSGTSPKQDREPELYELLSERSELPGKVAFWIGALLSLWLFLGAYQADGEIADIRSIDDLIPMWYDWVWTGLAGLGLVVSFVVCSYLMSIRKRGDMPYDALAAIGGAISLIIVIVMLLEYIESIHEFITPDGGFIWPGAKPLWFMPLSALGVTLPLVALILVRGGDVRDQALGLFLACAPVVVFSLPYLMGMDQADLVRWIPTIYFTGGLALMLSGLRPFERSGRITLESMEMGSTRVFAGMLVFTGIVSWRVVSSDGLLKTSADAVWIVPLVVNLIMAVALLAAVNNAPPSTLSWRRDSATPGGRRSLLVLLTLAFATAMISVVLLSLMALGYLDAFEYSPGDPLYPLMLERSMWLYPLSLLGTTLVMFGLNLVVQQTRLDRLGGLLCASLPAVVTASLAVAWYILSKPEIAHPLLADGIALLTYFGFAVAILVSGMRVETFFKLQLPVLREKSALSRKRYKEIMSLVMRNPMGAIGLAILAVFVVIAITGPYIAPYEVDMTVNGPFGTLEPPSPEHWMGTDMYRHDIFSELLYGAETSMTVGLVAAAISSILGAAIGLYSGYAGGWKDEVIMRMNDIALSIPWLVLMIIIAAFMGEITLVGIILVIGLTGWSGTARLVRAQVLSLKERQYIERARAIGSDDMHIITRHILPNAFPLVFANTILTVAGSILAEATLSFLGLEPQGVVTWGTMLSYAQEAGAFTIGMHAWIIAPGLCIVFVVLGFTLLGYALDDVMNPKLRKR